MRDNKPNKASSPRTLLKHHFYLSNLTSHTRDANLCSPQTPILDLVSNFKGLYNGSWLLTLYRNRDECLVPVRVKLLPLGVELRHSILLQSRQELLVRKLYT